jgi:hypothetical protein
MSELPQDKPLTVGDMRTLLRDRSRLLKNGETWGEYAAKWITPQNLLIVVMAIFTVGGRVQQAQTDITEAAKVAQEAITVAANISQKFDEVQGTVISQQATINKLQADAVTKDDINGAVKSGVAPLVTRREWRELLDIQQQISRRLDRIEKSVDK